MVLLQVEAATLGSIANQEPGRGCADAGGFAERLVSMPPSLFVLP